MRWALAALLLAGCSSARPVTAPFGEPATMAAHRPWNAVSRSRPLLSPAPLPALLLRIRWCESRNQYRARNAHSSASGAYQATDQTWAQYRGYRHASDAPVFVQDTFAVELFAARGTEPWDSSKACWR